MGINDFPMTPPKRPLEVTGVWLDAHSGRIRVRVEFGGRWHTVIDETNDEGHISHIVEPSGILKAPLSEELGCG
jgi:hypothetical protein